MIEVIIYTDIIINFASLALAIVGPGAFDAVSEANCANLINFVGISSHIATFYALVVGVKKIVWNAFQAKKVGSWIAYNLQAI